MAKNKDYNRPNRNWECGWAKDGKSCPRGPTPDGHCHTTTECEPARQSDRFVCTRLQQRGGKCEKGPSADGKCCLVIPPCVPVRSLRAKRGLASFYAVAVSVGILLISLGVRPSADHFLSAGPLSNPHRSIKHDCATCHGGEKDALPVQWLVKAHDPHLISKNCQSCHSSGDHAFSPHGMNPEALQAITKAKLGPEHEKNFRAPAGQLECATCHAEHRGMDLPIAQISAQQCQSCHVEKFKSFSAGHPEFKSFPFERRTRIHFDHSAHFSKYFAEGKRPEISCTQCHLPDSQGQHIVLRGFEKSCATCHEPAIRGVDQMAKGIVFWRLPGLDVKSLKSAHIGSWPEDTDGKLTPYQKLLLAGDERFAPALKTVADLDLADLSSATPEQLKAASTVAWGVKVMLQELGAEGGPYLKSHLEKSLGGTIPDVKVAELLGSLPVDLLRSAGPAWFKKFSAENAAWAAKKPAPTASVSVKDASDQKDEAWTESGGGWYRKTANFTISLRPRGHADPFIAGWLDLLSGAPSKDALVTKSFDGLADPKAAGTCVKCHSVEQAADGKAFVNWHGKNSENSPRGFVRFVHSAHFNLLGEKGCVTCHTANPSPDFDKNMDGRDPHNFSSGFLPIKKESCVACHTKDRVDQSCQSCHNYHIDSDTSHKADFGKIQTKF